MWLPQLIPFLLLFYLIVFWIQVLVGFHSFSHYFPLGLSRCTRFTKTFICILNLGYPRVRVVRLNQHGLGVFLFFFLVLYNFSGVGRQPAYSLCLEKNRERLIWNNRREIFIFLSAIQRPGVGVYNTEEQWRKRQKKALRDISHLMKKLKEIKCENAACIS